MIYTKVSLTIPIFIFVAAILTGPTTLLQISQAQINSSAQNSILSIHNNERSAVGVQPLTWSNSLASASQNYANQLASQGFSCMQTCNPDIPHGATNENLAWG